MNQEKIEKNINIEEIDFNALREKVGLIKKEEMAKKERREEYDPHFEKINPNNLTEKDLMIFKDFSEDRLTSEEFLKYKGEFDSISHEAANKDSRPQFMAWLANKMMYKQIKKRENKS